MKKILVIRLGAIGDFVFTTIIPYAIKLKYPDYEIHYLLPEGISDLASDNPYIDKVYTWERSKRKSFKYVCSVIKTLFKENYDVIFNLNNTLKSFIISRFAFPHKIVQKKQFGGHWAEDAFLSAKSVFPELEKPKRLYLGVSAAYQNELRSFVGNYPKPHVMITPGGDTHRNRAGRAWSLDKWKELSSMILSEYGGTVFVCGSESEREYHKKLENGGVVVLSGKYNLPQSSALLSLADIVISGDTGTLHIASAHNVKTLALLGSTSPDKVRPYGENGHWVSSDYDCKYCWNKKCVKTNDIYAPCMTNLSSEQVMQEIRKIL